MKQLTMAMIAITLTAGLFSCRKETIGEGPVLSETRTVQNFTAIELQMNGNVYYRNESTWSLQVSAKESILPILQTNVVNGKLVVRYNNGKTYDNDESIRITVSGPGVSSFVTTTSGNIHCLNAITPASLYIRSGGSGNISLNDITTGSIEAESKMSGRITAGQGSVITESLKTDGSGKIDLTGIAAKYASTRIIGSGDIKLKVSDKLDATINGSGSVYFIGTPSITSHISGTGNLIHW
jgi:hypothetical protein